MKCRSIFILAVSLLASPLAYAASDHSNSGTGQSEWAAGPSGSAANERGAGNRNPPGQVTSIADSLTPTPASDQNDALDAVSAGEALPLASLIAMVARQGLGKVLDAKLLSIRGHLVYRLVFLSDDGIARPAYFAADTGKPVRVP